MSNFAAAAHAAHGSSHAALIVMLTVIALAILARLAVLHRRRHRLTRWHLKQTKKAAARGYLMREHRPGDSREYYL